MAARDADPQVPLLPLPRRLEDIGPRPRLLLRRGAVWAGPFQERGPAADRHAHQHLLHFPDCGGDGGGALGDRARPEYGARQHLPALPDRAAARLLLLHLLRANLQLMVLQRNNVVGATRAATPLVPPDQPRRRRISRPHFRLPLGVGVGGNTSDLAATDRPLHPPLARERPQVRPQASRPLGPALLLKRVAKRRGFRRDGCVQHSLSRTRWVCATLC
mmetsp:Transcript_11546/g.27977  ORF Transcript_11546/g.27977 Transcript_11546/m.27977 type:complete len:218 (+) Transcript_11546:173-826(+)